MGRDYILSAKDEARLAAWHRQAQERKERSKRAGPCVTIAREFGCQAYPLAAELAKQLGEPWVVVDKEILEEVARITGYSLDQLEKTRDTPPALKAIFAMFLDDSRAEETEVFGYLKQTIRKFASAGNCIIVGSGGGFAAAEVQNCFHLRLVAPHGFRVEKIRSTREMEERAAIEFIDLHQKQREDFIQRLAGTRLDDPKQYHMVLNNALFTPEQMACLVRAGMEQAGVG